MKHKLCSRALTALLTFMLVIGLLPATVMAADTATVQINGQVLQNGVAVQCGEGTAVLDEENSTLTLDNATINQEGNTPVVRVDGGELKVILIGENTISSTTQRPFYITSTNIIIQGTETDSLKIQTDSDGLQVDNGNLTIDGCKIDITSTSWGGMMCFGILSIQNGANITIDSLENTLIGNDGLSITDSTVNATSHANYSTSAIHSADNMFITNSTVTATSNGASANAIYNVGNISINNSELVAITTSENANPAICADGNIDITNHSYVTVDSRGSIGIWSIDGAITIQDSIGYVSANDEWDAIRGAVGGATIKGSWVETFGSKISPAFTSADSVIFLNNTGTASGSLMLPGSVTVGSDMQLSIPDGSSISVPSGVTFTNHGQIQLLGNLTDDGGEIVCDRHAGGTATCTSKAVCDICGNEYGDILPHKLTKTDKKVSTCTESGNREYWTCETCGKLFSDAEGKTEIALKETVIAAKGHGTTELKNAKEATCTKEGYTGDKVCKDCGIVLETGKVVPKIAHDYKDGKCTVCGAVDPDYKADTSSPQTGDDRNIALWIAVMLAAGAVLTGTAFYRRKRIYSR